MPRALWEASCVSDLEGSAGRAVLGLTTVSLMRYPDVRGMAEKMVEY
jgi:hypothetical protein